MAIITKKTKSIAEQIQLYLETDTKITENDLFLTLYSQLAPWYGEWDLSPLEKEPLAVLGLLKKLEDKGLIKDGQINVNFKAKLDNKASQTLGKFVEKINYRILVISYCGSALTEEHVKKINGCKNFQELVGILKSIKEGFAKTNEGNAEFFEAADTLYNKFLKTDFERIVKSIEEKLDELKEFGEANKENKVANYSEWSSNVQTVKEKFSLTELNHCLNDLNKKIDSLKLFYKRELAGATLSQSKLVPTAGVNVDQNQQLTDYPLSAWYSLYQASANAKQDAEIVFQTEKKKVSSQLIAIKIYLEESVFADLKAEFENVNSIEALNLFSDKVKHAEQEEKNNRHNSIESLNNQIAELQGDSALPEKAAKVDLSLQQLVADEEKLQKQFEQSKITFNSQKKSFELALQTVKQFISEQDYKLLENEVQNFSDLENRKTLLVSLINRNINILNSHFPKGKNRIQTVEFIYKPFKKTYDKEKDISWEVLTKQYLTCLKLSHESIKENIFEPLNSTTSRYLNSVLKFLDENAYENLQAKQQKLIKEAPYLEEKTNFDSMLKSFQNSIKKDLKAVFNEKLQEFKTYMGEEDQDYLNFKDQLSRFESYEINICCENIAKLKEKLGKRKTEFSKMREFLYDVLSRHTNEVKSNSMNPELSVEDKLKELERKRDFYANAILTIQRDYSEIENRKIDPYTPYELATLFKPGYQNEEIRLKSILTAVDEDIKKLTRQKQKEHAAEPFLYSKIVKNINFGEMQKELDLCVKDKKFLELKSLDKKVREKIKTTCFDSIVELKKDAQEKGYLMPKDLAHFDKEKLENLSLETFEEVYNGKINKLDSFLKLKKALDSQRDIKKLILSVFGKPLTASQEEYYMKRFSSALGTLQTIVLQKECPPMMLKDAQAMRYLICQHIAEQSVLETDINSSVKEFKERIVTKQKNEKSFLQSYEIYYKKLGASKEAPTKEIQGWIERIGFYLGKWKLSSSYKLTAFFGDGELAKGCRKYEQIENIISSLKTPSPSPAA